MTKEVKFWLEKPNVFVRLVWIQPQLVSIKAVTMGTSFAYFFILICVTGCINSANAACKVSKYEDGKKHNPEFVTYLNFSSSKLLS